MHTQPYEKNVSWTLSFPDEVGRSRICPINSTEILTLRKLVYLSSLKILIIIADLIKYTVGFALFFYLITFSLVFNKWLVQAEFSHS